MKKTIIILALLFVAISPSIAQKYKIYLDSADIYFAQEKYFEAYERYNAARVFGKKIPSIVAKGEAGMKKSITQIKIAVIEMKKQKKIADKMAERTRERQLKIDTDKFDLAIKERYIEWIGYYTYEIEENENPGAIKDRKEILNKIDTLDFSSQNLLYLP